MIQFTNRWKLFDLFSIPVYLDFSFGIILLLLTLQTNSLEFGLGIAVMLAVSILFHEFAHALTARLFGYKTRDITLSLLGGCASLCALPKKNYQEFLVAIAGPLSSLFLAGVAFFSLNLMTMQVFFSYGGQLVLCTMYMNVMLGLFNLLPALPMDGGRIFRSVLSFKLSKLDATRIAMYVGRVMALSLIILPAFGIEHIWFIPIGGSVFFRFLIAYMIWQEGYREYQLAVFESRFRSWTQQDFKARVSPPPYEED